LDDPSNLAETLKFVHSYSHSHEPRVRSAAFKTMVRFVTQKHQVPNNFNLYFVLASTT
jgi:hypothetical protein